ncbi:unnamed protein product [Peronospora effusa]|nr:unnamed protein product [Peronospora effusa]
MELLQNAGFTAGAFDAQFRLLESAIQWIRRSSRSWIFQKDIILDRHNICQRNLEGESDDSINMQRMSLGPAGAAHIRERLAPIKAREQSTTAPTAEDIMWLE